MVRRPRMRPTFMFGCGLERVSGEGAIPSPLTFLRARWRSDCPRRCATDVSSDRRSASGKRRCVGSPPSWAPEVTAYLDIEAEAEEVPFDDEEDQVRQLLERFRVDSSEETSWIAAILTRRSMSPRHLWQDLGLATRDELGRLMAERFPALAERNSQHMKWKKFFYRSLCELEGFVLCSSPTCRECSDFHDCFGDESGESALARLGQLDRPKS